MGENNKEIKLMMNRHKNGVYAKVKNEKKFENKK